MIHIPKYNIGETICYKDDIYIAIGKIEGVQMVNSRKRMISYYACGRYFKEEEVKLLIIERGNKKSEWYKYPYFG